MKIMAEVESSHQSVVEAKSEKDTFLLDKSLKELKDLRSQLHYAADYCESSFLKSNQKDQVVENTKEYICRAVITVVDHLGSASANLDKIISQDKTIPEAELRLDCLSQRLLVCKEFSKKSALADLCWNPRLSKHHSQYLLAGVSEQGNSISRMRDVKVPSYAEAKSGDQKVVMNSSEVKSDNEIQKWPKVQDTGFEFQEKTRKPHNAKKVRVLFHRRGELLSLLRGTKRIARVN